MRLLLSIVIASLALPALVAAQNTASAPPPEAPPPEAPPPESPPSTTADQAAAPDVAASPRVAEPPPAPPPEVVPPLMVAVLTTGRVPEDVATAAAAALVEQLRPLAGGRPVLPLAVDEMRARLAACTDAPCQGAFLGEAGAIGAVIARLSRRATRGPLAITLEMIDPVSGAPRVTPVTGELTDAASTPTTIAALIEPLRGVMFSPPPPPPTLLVTVNVDGATILIDGASVGESPIASQRLTRGHHVVMVTRTGYSGLRRELELEPGQQERLDLTLAPLDVGVTEQIALDGTTTTTRAPEPEWYEQWYVWAGVGAGVLVIGAIVLGVVIGTQPTPAAPDPAGIPLPSLTF